MKIKNNLIKSACLLSVFALCAGCAEQTVKTGETTSQSSVTENTAQVNATVEQTEPHSETEKQTEAATATETTVVVTKAHTASAVSTSVKQATTAAGSTSAARQSTLLKNLQAAGKISGYYFLKSSDVDSLAKNIADNSRVYFVRLDDGTKTYYMAVDLTTAQALSLANRDVLTQVCRELDARQQRQAGGKNDYVLMDYTHLVGELEIHFLGYLLTGALGAENGPLARFYRSCAVADLNIDENRLGPMIQIIGAIYG